MLYTFPVRAQLRATQLALPICLAVPALLKGGIGLLHRLTPPCLLLGVLLFTLLHNRVQADNGPSALGGAGAVPGVSKSSVAPVSPAAGTNTAPIVAPPTPAAPGGNSDLERHSFDALREAIAASNRTVDHVSTVFQAFGLWIGVLVTLLTTAGGFLAWFTFKSLAEARAEHKAHLMEHKDEWKASLASFRADAKAEMEKFSTAAKVHAEAAEESAKGAARIAAEMETEKALVDQLMKDMDQMRGIYRANILQPSPDAAGTAPPAVPLADDIEDEAAQVEAELRNKVGSSPATPPPA